MAATKPDFAQKLLNDLRRRKERMAAATQNSGPADAYGNSKQVLRGSRERTRTIQSAGQKIRSRFKSPSASHKSPATVQASNQIVPYGGGANHNKGELGDISMALACAFDNGGKLKRIDFTGSGKMMDFFQQIGRRSMHQGSNMQWSSTNQFPTLTHLHIDEIAKAAQKLNQILRACSNGSNIDKGTVEIGKELWKGAMELEQSLRMLVSLQEASESMVSPRRKTQLKLLEEDEENEEGNNTSSKEKEKQVERPVFSFDKVSKNRRNTAQTSLQQSLMALTYLKEDPHVEVKKQAPTVVSTKAFHGRSASSDGLEFHHHNSSSKEKHYTGVPNVIAKLMGLEEFPQNANPKAAEQRNVSQQKSGDIVTTRNIHSSPRGAEVKIEGKPSNKIAILNYHEPRMRQETFKLTYDYSYGATPQSHKPMWHQKEGEGIKNNVIESKAVISKINELQNQITQQSRASSIQKDVKKETRSISIQRKQQQVKDETNTMRTMAPMKIQSSRAEDKAQAERRGNWSHQTEKRTTNKPLHPQQKPNNQESIEAPPGPEAEANNLKSEDGHHQRTNSKSQLRKTEAPSRRLINAQNAAGYEKKLQKQPVIKQPNSRKRNNTKPKRIIASAMLLSSGQNKEIGGKAANSDAKQQNPSSTKGVAGLPKTENEVIEKTDAKPALVLARKMVNEIKPPKNSSTTKTRVMQEAKMLARAIKPHINLLEVSQTHESQCKPTQIVQEKANQSVQESQEVDAEDKAVTDNLLTHQFQSQEEITELPPNKNSQNEEILEDSSTQHKKEIVPDEVQENRPQSTTMRAATGNNKDSKDDLPLQPTPQRPTKIEKQPPLTEDELHLKQKLITSPILLNTAEALFKLNIPIGILNYAIDQTCQGRDNKLTLDCSYELLKMKGRRKEIILHPHINTFVRCTKVRSFDDLVRQLYKDMESLRSYGRHGTEELDEADYILRMLERDIKYGDPDINCMWDLGWNDIMFAYDEMHEVIRDMEHKILDELMNEMTKDYMSSSNFVAVTA